MKSSIEARLDSPETPTGKRAAVKKFFRAKAKDAARVATDQEEIKKLGEQLDRGIEDFGVRISMTQIFEMCSGSPSGDLLHPSRAGCGRRARTLCALVKSH
jgi:hypothetical protein